MNLDYVQLAYAVFVVVLAWDFVAPRVRLAQLRRATALKLQREQARKPA